MAVDDVNAVEILDVDRILDDDDDDEAQANDDTSVDCVQELLRRACIISDYMCGDSENQDWM
jgi:hypothetical protein